MDRGMEILYFRAHKFSTMISLVNGKICQATKGMPTQIFTPHPANLFDLTTEKPLVHFGYGKNLLIPDAVGNARYSVYVWARDWFEFPRPRTLYF